MQICIKHECAQALVLKLKEASLKIDAFSLTFNSMIFRVAAKLQLCATQLVTSHR